MLIHGLLYHQPKQYTMKGKIPQFYHTFAAFDPRHKNAYLNDHCYKETWGESLLLLCFGALLHTPLAWRILETPFLAASPEHRSAVGPSSFILSRESLWISSACSWRTVHFGFPISSIRWWRKLLLTLRWRGEGQMESRMEAPKTGWAYTPLMVPDPSSNSMAVSGCWSWLQTLSHNRPPWKSAADRSKAQGSFKKKPWSEMLGIPWKT